MSYQPIYADESAIRDLVKFVGDNPSATLMNTVIKNADSTVNSRLRRHSLPTYQPGDEDIPGVLGVCANYYAVSDLLQSMYGKDDRSTNEKGFYEKAEILMDDYITQQLVQLEDTVLEEQSPYGYSQSPDAFELGLLHR